MDLFQRILRSLGISIIFIILGIIFSSSITLSWLFGIFIFYLDFVIRNDLEKLMEGVK